MKKKNLAALLCAAFALVGCFGKDTDKTAALIEAAAKHYKIGDKGSGGGIQ